MRPSSDDAIVQQVMEEELQRKHAKKGQGPQAKDKTKQKGMTLEELEQLEFGGVVKESAAAMAQTKRALKRKAKAGGTLRLSEEF